MIWKQPDEITDMYSRMDRDGSGSLDFDEFLIALRKRFT